MLVQPSSDSVDHRLPSLNQAFQLCGLAAMTGRDLFQLGHFLAHQRNVANRPEARSRHFGVAMQCLAAENYAVVGFGWGHGGAE